MAAPGMPKLHDRAQLTMLSEGQLCQVFQVNLDVASTASIHLSSATAAACNMPYI